MNELEQTSFDFLSTLISQGWEKISELDLIKQAAKNDDRIVKIIQNLSDAYLIAVGQLESIAAQSAEFSKSEQPTETIEEPASADITLEEPSIEDEATQEIKLDHTDVATDSDNSFDIDFDEPIKSNNELTDRQQWLSNH